MKRTYICIKCQDENPKDKPCILKTTYLEKPTVCPFRFESGKIDDADWKEVDIFYTIITKVCYIIECIGKGILSISSYLKNSFLNKEERI